MWKYYKCISVQTLNSALVGKVLYLSNNHARDEQCKICQTLSILVVTAALLTIKGKTRENMRGVISSRKVFMY